MKFIFHILVWRIHRNINSFHFVLLTSFLDLIAKCRSVHVHLFKIVTSNGLMPTQHNGVYSKLMICCWYVPTPVQFEMNYNLSHTLHLQFDFYVIYWGIQIRKNKIFIHRYQPYLCSWKSRDVQRVEAVTTTGNQRLTL